MASFPSPKLNSKSTSRCWIQTGMPCMFRRFGCPRTHTVYHWPECRTGHSGGRRAKHPYFCLSRLSTIGFGCWRREEHWKECCTDRQEWRFPQACRVINGMQHCWDHSIWGGCDLWGGSTELQDQNFFSFFILILLQQSLSSSNQY